MLSVFRLNADLEVFRTFRAFPDFKLISSNFTTTGKTFPTDLTWSSLPMWRGRSVRLPTDRCHIAEVCAASAMRAVATITVATWLVRRTTACKVESTRRTANDC